MKKDDKITEILQHLEKYGITDKDSFAMNRDAIRKKRLQKIDEFRSCKLDLHGLTTREAARSLRIALESCRQRGVREILVIHGKGYHSDSENGPVLKKLVQQMLENELAGLIRNFRPAKFNEGGEGATLVTLRP